jgi:hypothetical protein
MLEMRDMVTISKLAGLLTRRADGIKASILWHCDDAESQSGMESTICDIVGRSGCLHADQFCPADVNCVVYHPENWKRCCAIRCNPDCVCAPGNPGDIYRRMDTAIDHVTDFAKIAAYGVMTTPALVVDGKVVSYGKVLKPDEVSAILKKVRG